MARTTHPRPIAWLLLTGLLLPGCGGEPFDYVDVAGKVTYEDGTPIPVEPLVLTFYPQAAPVDSKTHPRPGLTVARKEDGTFSLVSSHKANDGLVAGRHKVTLTNLDGGALDPSLVPAEYADPATTPLEIDTADAPFHLKVRKP